MSPRDNPFRCQLTDSLEYEFEDDMNWPKLLQRLEALRWRGAIIGMHGRGKSTLLDGFACRLQDAGWSTQRLGLRSEERNFSKQIWRELLPSFGRRDFVLLDGAEQLSLWRWKRFLQLTKSAGGVLIATHRAGRLPTLYECRSSPQLLRGLVERLDPELEFCAQSLFERNSGNLRNCLRALYDTKANDLQTKE